MDDKFLKPYNPQETEAKIYKIWEESGFFNPDECIKAGVCDKNAEHFSIVLPPPNVTGVLHLGHSLMLAIEDIMIRFNRMNGKKTLWVPGTDHAAIATQNKVEKDLYKKEKKTCHDIGRKDFLKMVEKFAQESHDTIVSQVKKMGASIDWSREAYTLDNDRALAVNTAFKRMYEGGIIYRGERIINWDPRLKTTVSNDEVERVERKTPFYYFQYGPFEIATARPETKFGDKFVVMHPKDSRYTKYKHGETFELEWINGPITATVIKDEAIDTEFGTGVMTITPAHDQTDFDIAERHKLKYQKIIDLDGKLMSPAGEFEGMYINKARPLIVEKLKEKGLLTKTDENYTHAAAINSRGGETIEPQILKQWFIDVNKEFELKNSKIDGVKSGSTTTLKKLMRQSVESGQIEIIPKKFEKTYFHWIDNLRDWNISRQIWYGHQVPVWYHENKCIPKKDGESDFEKCQEMIVSEEMPVCKHCDSKYIQDTDTLDTWFSSGLWTFSTLGWPKETEDMKNYHPTTVLETGYDIIFFWVAKMILMSTYLLGDIPFQKVYLHGMVRDEKGKKMSKSLGNAVDPLEMIENFGTDALRMAMIVGVGPGNDINLSEDKVKAYKHFSNKIWNVSRFVLENLPEDFDYKNKPTLSSENKEHLKRLDKVSKGPIGITQDIEADRLHLASGQLYDFFWHEFADEIIETTKNRINRGQDKESNIWTIFHILITFLKMLHPFMPFITEEIWQSLPENAKDRDLLLISSWPEIE